MYRSVTCVSNQYRLLFRFMNEPQAPSLLLRIGEVAQILKMSKLTVYRMIKNGDGLPVVRIGKRRSLRVPRLKFMQWAGLEALEEKSNAQPNNRNGHNGVVAVVQNSRSRAGRTR